jgi:hypothetical protein
MRAINCYSNFDDQKYNQEFIYINKIIQDWNNLNYFNK